MSEKSAVEIALNLMDERWPGYAAAKKIIRDALLSRESAWMAIESAPRDGTKFLAWWDESAGDPGDSDATIEIVCFKGLITFFGLRMDVGCAKPTHWMLLPKGPNNEA